MTPTTGPPIAPNPGFALFGLCSSGLLEGRHLAGVRHFDDEKSNSYQCTDPFDSGHGAISPKLGRTTAVDPRRPAPYHVRFD